MGRSFRISLILCGVFAGWLGLTGQVFYSTNPNYLRTKNEQNNLISSYKPNYPDTSIAEIAHFFPRNFLGNIGLPSPNYNWNYGTSGLGFIFFRPPYESDHFNEQDVEYVRSAGPYASLNGIAGNRKLQIFRLYFTHTYRDKINLTLKFRRYSSQGLYYRQETYANNFFVSSNYETKNRRAGYYMFFMNNSNKNNENGGLKAGFLSDTTASFLKDALKVKISDADRDNREFRAMINPYLRFNYRSDSNHVLDHFIQLKSHYADRKYRYIDGRSWTDGYYSDFFLDTITRDSSHHRQFTNEISYALMDRERTGSFSAGYRHEVNQVYQLYDTVLINTILFGDVSKRFMIKSKDSTQRVLFSADNLLSAQYGLNGPNGGNTKIEGRTLISLARFSKWQLVLSALMEERNPDEYYKRWVSNHFIWNNDFLPVMQVHYKVGLDYMNRFGVSFLQQNIFNYVYFDQFALPAQVAGGLSNTQFVIHFTSLDIPHLGLAANGVYQKSSRPEIVRTPETSLTAKLFYYGSLFRNNLNLNIGFQGQFYKPFLPYAYMPSTQAFYIQNTVSTKSYPYVDFFLNARIRPVSFFVKLENILQPFLPPDYYLTPGYYQTDLVYRFGLTWMFFD